MEDCNIISHSLGCVDIHDAADPRLRRNRVQGGSLIGIHISKNGRCTLENNTIQKSAIGILVTNSGYAAVRNNAISNCSYLGLFITRQGGGIFENNDIRDNEKAWEIDNSSKENVTMSGNIEE